MRILLFDNYDSFTYNLVHLIEKVSNHTVEVFRNDKISLEEINRFDRIVLSPGPGIPVEAGILLEVIKTYAPTKPILGVCLGHQAIGEAFGAKLINLDKVYHGVATSCEVFTDDVLFKNIPGTFNVGRYHSWVIEKESLPEEFEITAVDGNGLIMAMKHKTLPMRGVQFHPESILTEYGEVLMKNWLDEILDIRREILDIEQELPERSRRENE